MRVLQQDVSEEWTCGAEDRLVRRDLLVVSGGQGDISKVVGSSKMFDRVERFFAELLPVERDFSRGWVFFHPEF